MQQCTANYVDTRFGIPYCTVCITQLTSFLGFRSVLIPATKWLHFQNSPRIMWTLCENLPHCGSLLFSANLSRSIPNKSTLHYSTWSFLLHTEARKPCGSRLWIVYSRSCFDKMFETAGFEILGRTCHGLRVLLAKQIGQRLTSGTYGC